jgi:hypothetical protein
MSVSLRHELVGPVDVGNGLDRIDRGDGTTVFRYQQPCPRAHALQVTAEMCLQFTNAHRLHMRLQEVTTSLTRCGHTPSASPPRIVRQTIEVRVTFESGPTIRMQGRDMLKFYYRDAA